ncbi:MAG: uroporphyrinogen decarboxylase family protein [candidate division KSB1 bacterium]|nr:uroporphyrinogen decarboxylase family protein [candidate division KSB1 bacterium]
MHRWHKEGLPCEADWFEFLCKNLGIPVESRTDLFGLDLINLKMYPAYEEKVLVHKDGHYVVRDWMGNVVEISDEYDYTYIRSPKDFVTRKWHAFPVATRSDFEKMKVRYNPEEKVRYPSDFDALMKKVAGRDVLFTIHFAGPLWQLREWCGFEPMCMLFLEDPEFVREMVQFYTNFISKTLRRALDTGMVDRIWISEDMAYKEKSMISPQMARDFLMPAWSKWIGEAREAGVQVLDVDSDGYVGELIPLWIESGFNVCDPMEVAAGNDVIAFRGKYGEQIAFQQGVDKRCIAQGGGAILSELERIRPLLKSGGFIPGCDHGVPYDISWDNFVFYSTLLAEMTGWL